MKKPNKLINQSSPYLLEHAYNPVNWYPWSDEAFKAAEKEDKPIFLSIGYSACHWCHVMAKESFEDEEVAALLNEVFINIKVDREERPDIDKIFMEIAMAMLQHAGWPLTIIMTSDKKPFFAGTYIPKYSAKDGSYLGMLDLIENVKILWANQRQKIIKSTSWVKDYLAKLSKKSHIKVFDSKSISNIMDKAYIAFENFFDHVNGGFGISPKFPMAHNLMFLLRYYSKTKNENALYMVEKTLQRMRNGGIWDHMGYGFHRYSTDQMWLLPHFEKMLYDQALLSMAYLEAFKITKNEIYKDTAINIYTYVLRDMTSKENGTFYAAEDADSEGEEGKYYIWTMDQIKKVLSRSKSKNLKNLNKEVTKPYIDDIDFAIDIFNIKEEGNFSDEATGKKSGKNILHLTLSLDEIALKYQIGKKEALDKIQNIIAILFKARRFRKPPLKDDKILTDWNGLMIASLAKAARVFGDFKGRAAEFEGSYSKGVFSYTSYINLAIKAADFILSQAKINKKELFHSLKSGNDKTPANLDDYAFFIWGLLELYESTFNTEYLKAAIDLTDISIEKFYDNINGGFYFTSIENSDVMERLKYGNDGTIPGGNSVSMLNLLKLAYITSRKDLLNIAENTGRFFFSDIEKNPDFHSMFISALDFLSGPVYEVVICGKKNSKDTKEMFDVLNSEYIPNKVVLFKPDFEPDNKSYNITDSRLDYIQYNESESIRKDKVDIVKIAPYTADYKAIDGKATAYVCINYSCKLPTNKPSYMLKLLGR